MKKIMIFQLLKPRPQVNGIKTTPSQRVSRTHLLLTEHSNLINLSNRPAYLGRTDDLTLLCHVGSFPEMIVS